MCLIHCVRDVFWYDVLAAEIREVFKVFDQKADLTIHVKHIALALRALGRLPTKNDIDEIVTAYAPFRDGETVMEYIVYGVEVIDTGECKINFDSK